VEKPDNAVGLLVIESPLELRIRLDPDLNLDSPWAARRSGQIIDMTLACTAFCFPIRFLVAASMRTSSRRASIKLFAKAIRILFGLFRGRHTSP
jgi:hypothetical protein